MTIRNNNYTSSIEVTHNNQVEQFVPLNAPQTGGTAASLGAPSAPHHRRNVLEKQKTRRVFMNFNSPIPILRSFDKAKAKEFYVDFLGFTVDWEHRIEDNTSLYMRLSKGSCVIHLSEHHGDSSPGASLRIMTLDLDAYKKELLEKV